MKIKELDDGNQSGNGVHARGGYTPRCDEKSAEMIDKQRVVRRPLRKRVCNSLKRKDLNVRKAEMDIE